MVWLAGTPVSTGVRCRIRTQRRLPGHVGIPPTVVLDARPRRFVGSAAALLVQPREHRVARGVAGLWNMDKNTQIQRARRFLELHHAQRLLVLPNVWDAGGARLLAGLGYPAVATASASVAFSLGYDDGELITFGSMLAAVHRIAAGVDIPVSADIERGYADTRADLANNIHRVLRAGAVGINIEDSTVEGGPLRPIDDQCERIRTVRRAATDSGIPLVINARTDVFLSHVSRDESTNIREAVERANRYAEAGADCIYPIGTGDLKTLEQLRGAIAAPLNVFASADTAPLRQLEAAGINRVSIGPGLFRASLTAMREVAVQLRDYGSYDGFAKRTMTSDDIRAFLSREKMPPGDG